MTRKILWLLLAIAFSGSVPLSAQLNTLAADNPRETSRLRLGPVYASPALQLADLGIDSNVLSEDRDPRRDFTFTLTPSATFWLPLTRRGLLKADVSSSMVWYQQTTEQRSVN